MLQLSLAFSYAYTVEQVIEAIAAHAFPTLDADRGVIALLTPAGDELIHVRHIGYSTEIIERYPRTSLSASVPLSEAVRERKAVFVETFEDRHSHYPTTLEPRLERMGTLVVLPLIANDTPSGALGVSWSAYKTLSAEERAFMQSVAQMCAQTIERARLYDAAQRELEERRATEVALAAEREQLRAVIEEMPAAVLIMAPAGNVLLANQEAERFYGIPDLTILPAETWLHRKIYRLDGSAVPLEEYPLVRSMKSGEVVQGEEYRFQRGDGNWATILANSAPLHDREGRIVAGILTFYDITLQKEAENALRQSEMRIQALMDSNLLGIIVADDTRILEANDHFLEMLGYTREDLEMGGLRWREMTPPEFLEQDDAGIAESRTHGTGALIRKEYFRKDGSRVPVILGGALLENNPERWLTFVLDLSAQQAAEERMSALNERLRRGIQETHHRVKNNLQIIGAMLDMSIMDAVDSLSLSEAKRIATQVKTLARVHDVLTSEAKQDRFGEALSSRTVLERLMPMLETAAGVSIVTHLDDVSLTIQQATALALIVNELTSNAVKHGRGEVEVTFYATSDEAILQVLDDGPGFAEGMDLRFAASTGLMLVEQVARHDLRGKLELGSRARGGAKVTVTFPL